MSFERSEVFVPDSKSPYGSEVFASALAREVSAAGSLQAMIDNLAEQVALVDELGTITMVNRAWAAVARSFHLGAFGVGDNYRAVCRQFADQGYKVGAEVLSALDEFDRGQRSLFEYTYSIPGPKNERFYKVVLSNLVLAPSRFLVITSYEITDLIALKRRNHELEQEKLRIQQEEGRRIGRDIHDTTAQDLAVLRLSVARLRQMHRDPQSLELFGDVDSALTHVIDDIRAISFMLHPPTLEEGLVEALGSMARGFARRTKLRIDVEFEGSIAPWGEHIEQVFYRIAQEALTNVHRHAGASKVRIRLVSRRTHMHMIIEDDGSGSGTRPCHAHQEAGVGIASMRSRLSELSGRFSICSQAQGTRVVASVPLAGAERLLRRA